MKYLVVFSCLLFGSVGFGAEVTIPLDQIWGYNLPGTRDIAGIPLPEGDEKHGVRQGFATLRSERERRIEDITKALTTKAPSVRAGAGFIIPRKTDFYALRGATSRLTSRRTENGKESFPEGEEGTIVFFSHPSGYYVRLKNVERKGHKFIVHYQFEPHATAETTVHFALIPTGQLRMGEYHVDFEQIPIERKYRDEGFKVVDDSSTVICQSFSFTVLEKPTYAEEAATANAILIPLEKIWAYRMPSTKAVQELEELGINISDQERVDRSLVFQINSILSKPPKEGEKAGEAFVVVGTGKEALKNAHAVITKKMEPAKELPTDRDLTLVFYSYLSGWYTHVASVEQSDRVITVKYRPVSHVSFDVTQHFALIPLGKLAEGKYKVEVKSLPPVDKAGGPGRTQLDPWRVVSQGFSFDVNKEQQ